ncbi:hypothetical protein GA0070624_2758 [Micromonospora rhizosphaerae]|uniref:Uncharacterized protein n=1 Tax=Micromonospora rhizosphaerae TaxID=568872 RepID=A0A1C6S2F7_9ACTN|nr:hypothetical protein GA0070624_2758 [Micromonospora rhizosphaerae]
MAGPGGADRSPGAGGRVDWPIHRSTIDWRHGDPGVTSDATPSADGQVCLVHLRDRARRHGVTDVRRTSAAARRVELLDRAEVRGEAAR